MRRRGNCCGRINVHLISLFLLLIYLHSSGISCLSMFPRLSHTLSLSHIHTARTGPFFIAPPSAGHMFCTCTVCVHRGQMCVRLRERCLDLHLLMGKIRFSDVSNIIPCYQRLICLPHLDLCHFRANGQKQSRLQAPDSSAD